MTGASKSPHDVVLPTGVAAQILAVSKDTVRRWLRSGKLSGLTLGEVLDVANPPHDVVLPTDVVAEVLGVSGQTVRRWLRQGRLRSQGLRDVLEAAAQTQPDVAKLPHEDPVAILPQAISAGLS